jgi:hypothetical protein
VEQTLLCAGPAPRGGEGWLPFGVVHVRQKQRGVLIFETSCHQVSPSVSIDGVPVSMQDDEPDQVVSPGC